jgi:hypothetical protein
LAALPEILSKKWTLVKFYMGSLEQIRQLIASMSHEERLVAKNMLHGFTVRGSDSESPLTKLYDLICREIESNQYFSFKELEISIYGEPTATGFPKLILRLREKLIETFILNVNLNRKGNFSERGKALHKLRKRLSEAQILYHRGLTDFAISLLNDSEKEALKFEFFEECLIALRTSAELLAIMGKKKQSYSKQIEYDRVCKLMQFTKKVQSYYFELAYQVENSAVPISTEILKSRIADAKMQFKEQSTLTAKFYLTFVETHYLQEQKLFIRASAVLEKQLKINNQHKYFFNDEQNVLLRLNFAWNELFTHNFQNAIKIVSTCENLLPDKAFNKLQAGIIKFHAHYYDGQYDLAEMELDKLDLIDNTDDSEFRAGKRTYYRACIRYMKAKNKEVNELLRNLISIEKDTEGWNIWVQFLLIINDIELELTENAFTRITNLRNKISKIHSSIPQQNRIILIYDVLRCLSNNKFDFAQVRKKKLNELSQLSDRSLFSWDVLTPELISIDQWFYSKLFKKPFKQTIPDYWEPAQTA